MWFLLIFSSVMATELPVWAPQFKVTFSDTFETVQPYFKATWNVIFYYDAVNKLSRYDMKEGQADGFCNSVIQSSEECRQIVNGEYRYIYWPTLDKCCYCCNTSAGCGIMSQDWMVGGSNVGTKSIDDRTCTGWLKKGASLNYYYMEEAKPYGIPCEIVMNYTTYWSVYDYDKKSYHEGYIPEDVFKVPDGCDKKCEGQLCSYF